MIQKSFTLLLLLILWNYDCVFLFWLAALWMFTQFVKLSPVQKVKETDFNVCIIGAGFSGLAMGKRLKDMGINFTIIEKFSRVGGTWWQNQYPGCACDVPTHLYTYSFYPNPYASRNFCQQNEILCYLEKFADDFHLNSSIVFGKSVEECSWDEDKNGWDITLSDGSMINANAIVSGCGPFHMTHTPNFKNKDLFKGKAMHSGEWDNSWNPSDRTVGIIGTGASAVQIIPQLAKSVRKLFVFQRSPSWSFPVEIYRYPKFLQSIFHHLPFTLYLHRLYHFCVSEARYFVGFRINGVLVNVFQKVAKSEIRKAVKDPHLQKALTPDYIVGCKRVTPSSTYLKTYNRDNVCLVTNPIEEFTENSIRTREKDYPVDTIIYATGFDLIKTFKYSYRCYGLNRRTLVGECENKPAAYLGMTHPSAPNIFFLLGPNTGLGHNSVVWMIECQINYVEDCFRNMIEKGLKSIAVKDHVFDDYQKWLRDWMANKVFQAGNCTSWYRNEDNVNFALWPSNLPHYWWMTRRVNLGDYNVIS